MKDEIKALQKKAQKFLKTAKLSLDNGDYDTTVSRVYYAMFFMAKAVLITKNIKAKTHSGVISAFGQYFVKNNIFPKYLGKNLNNAFDIRLIGDYEILEDIEKNQAEELLKEGKEFVRKIEEYLEKNKFL